MDRNMKIENSLYRRENTAIIKIYTVSFFYVKFALLQGEIGIYDENLCRNIEFILYNTVLLIPFIFIVPIQYNIR